MNVSRAAKANLTRHQAATQRPSNSNGPDDVPDEFSNGRSNDGPDAIYDEYDNSRTSQWQDYGSSSGGGDYVGAMFLG
jgi:hypothetical protein